MPAPKYATREYQRAYRALKKAQAEGVWHQCVEPVCKLPTRAIAPTQRASISHDPSGLVIIGPSHLTCNLSEGATRGNRMRSKRIRRLVL